MGKTWSCLPALPDFVWLNELGFLTTFIDTSIFLLSESFVDPLNVPGVTLSDDATQNIKDIQSVTTSGMMQSDVYGDHLPGFYPKKRFSLVNQKPSMIPTIIFGVIINPIKN